jgi:hypothetical protein
VAILLMLLGLLFGIVMAQATLLAVGKAIL